MPQLHFYVPNEIAEQVKARAAQSKLPVSRYVADLVTRDVCRGWPEHYFERISGTAEGARLEYEPSGPPEERLMLR